MNLAIESPPAVADPRELYPKLRLTRLRVRFAATGPASGYAGSAWRGVLGPALQQACCSRAMPACASCDLDRACVYHRCYETGGQGARFSTPPRPYILSPLADTGNGAGFILTLLETAEETPSAAQMLEKFQAAVVLLASAGHAPGATSRSLCALSVWHPDLGWQPIREGSDSPPVRPRSLQELLGGAPPAAPWRVELVTPLRCRHKGRYLDAARFDWGPVFRDLACRVAVLAGAALPDAALEAFLLDPGSSENHFQWQDWHRRSSRQQQRIPMGGLRGTALITVPPQAAEIWWRWWQLAQWLHLGKGTTMGLGRVRLSGDAIPAQASRCHDETLTNGTNDRRMC